MVARLIQVIMQAYINFIWLLHYRMCDPVIMLRNIIKALKLELALCNVNLTS